MARRMTSRGAAMLRFRKPVLTRWFDDVILLVKRNNVELLLLSVTGQRLARFAAAGHRIVGPVIAQWDLRRLLGPTSIPSERRIRRDANPLEQDILDQKMDDPRDKCRILPPARVLDLHESTIGMLRSRCNDAPISFIPSNVAVLPPGTCHCSVQLRLDLEHCFYLNARPSRQRCKTECAARVPTVAVLAEHFMKQIGRTVNDQVLVREL